ncbi:hypothetical protein MRY87_03410 [bacterium]|nr:hypothetical protein [bacterium]
MKCEIVSPEREENSELQSDTEPRLTLPSLLRGIGITLLIAASLVFLVQRWDGFSEIARYASFLGFTVALAGVGILCAIRLGDSRAARALLGIALFTVPIHGAQLGALLYSVFPESFAVSLRYPAMLHWQAPSAFSALLTTGLGMAVLVPLTFFAVSVYSRTSARGGTLLLLLTSGMLLLPLRDPNIVGWLVVGLLVVTGTLDSTVWRQEKELRTREGQFLRGLYFFPTVLLLGRNLVLYDTSAFFFCALFSGLSLVMFSVLPSYSEKRETRMAWECSAMAPAMIAVLLLTDQLVSLFQIGNPFVVPLFGILAAGVLGLASRFSTESGRNYLVAAALTLLTTIGWNTVLHPNILNSVLALLVSILGIIGGYTLRSTTMKWGGGLTLAITLLDHLRLAIEIQSYSPWMVLAFFGIGAVVFSSVIERSKHWP